MLKRLTDEEISDVSRVTEDSGVPINERVFYGVTLEELRGLCEAQLAADQTALNKVVAEKEAEIQSIFNTFENFFGMRDTNGWMQAHAMWATSEYEAWKAKYIKTEQPK